MRHLSILFALCLTAVGCQNNSDQPTTANNDPTQETVSHSESDSGYLAIFDQNYKQHEISSRMNKNFQRLEGKLGAADLHHFQSAGVKISVPEKMQVAERFTGFESKSNKENSMATLLILTNPFSMAKTTQQIVMDSVRDGSSGILFTERVNVDGRDGIFYLTKAKVDEILLSKFIIAFGDEEFSWIITSTFTGNMEAEFGSELLKSMLNIQVAESRLPPGQDVNFTMQPNRLVLTDGFVDKLLFTLTGKFPEDTVKEPIFQAGRSVILLKTNDKQALARNLVAPAPQFEVSVLSSEKEITIDDIDGYEFVAVGRDRLTDEPLYFYTVILYDGDDSYLMHGWVSTDTEENHIDDFRALARSFRRIKDGQGEPGSPSN